ncbi:TIR domain-containing protein [Marinomonas shanghaiensis]|uniref:TIR domain-containing protein n=1 Tax=Marinomonas shanghaiensis TaxID=2202418 RepID=UPI000DB9182F|nr:TIR domain-containing protein [Marinomonas shanghaiensis]
MNTPKRLEEVFKLSGVPDHTFVEPEEYDRLYIALRTPGRGVVIEGPSGIGKTTSVLKALNSLNLGEGVRVLSARRRNDISSIRDLLNKDAFGTVVIDDFHKLDDTLKKEFSDLLKILADEGSDESKLILVGINKTGNSLINYASDLRNRIDIIRFESNSDTKIQELLEKGEKALNVEIAIKSSIVQDSHGSFHLAQMLAHHACLKSKLFDEGEFRKTTVSFEAVKQIILDDLVYSFYAITINFCKGQRVKKGSRAPYLHVLYWLAESDNMSINITSHLIDHPNHKNSVGQITLKGHLKEHYHSNDEYSNVIYYNDETTELSVEDPKYFYYIKNLPWSAVARKIGFYGVDFKSKYDFALSFAGAQRCLAERLYSILADNEISVFYDNNEQSRILSADVEEYLAPIYRSESRFVVPFLSKEYPTRVWCKFEADHFKQRFGENSVIPLWMSDNPPGMFDESNGKGGFMVNYESEDAALKSIDDFADLLIDKIHQIRLEETQ